MVDLDHNHLATFRMVVDTLLPAVDGEGAAWTTPGSGLGLDQRLPELFAALPHDATRRDLRRLLGLLATRRGGAILFGRPRAFTAMAAHERADAYRAMEGSPVPMVRAGARALKSLAAYLWLTTLDPGSPPPAWEAIGYPGPDGPPPDTPKTIATTTLHGDVTMRTDVVVVGSGAGGATAAGVLAGAGLDVVVLEAGGYRNEADFSHLEYEAYRDMYLQRGLGTTADGGTILLAGATLGGGTVINYTTSFATPDAIREQWDRESAFRAVFTGAEYTASAAAVSARLEVNSDYGYPSSRAERLEKGLRRLGWHVAEMPRNAVGCTQDRCGYCTMGCRIGAKRSMLATYLADAAASGATVVVGADVRTILTDQGRARGVVAAVGNHTLRIESDAVVVAAGALNTPAILLRSGLGGKATGRHLRLHPVTVVWGRFAERVDPWTGIMQTRYSDQFADLDGSGYGFKFETAPVHPLFPASFLGWEDGPSFKRDVLGIGHLGVAGILLRDRGAGRVGIRRDGSPNWRYAISRHDQRLIREGVRRGAEVMAAAGAAEVIASTVRPVRWRPGSRPIDRFIHDVDAVGYSSNRMSYFSFHQMGSARMGSDPGESVVGPWNETHDTAGLYVMDGSCFPTASGVNPMLTIATIAHRAATRLAERLT
jgi:choline dehydrogenase-like flavoprotein